MTFSEGERLMRLETQVSDIKDDIQDVKTAVDNQTRIMTTFIDRLDERYSSKWVEKAVISLSGIIITAFLGIIVFLIERHII